MEITVALTLPRPDKTCPFWYAHQHRGRNPHNIGFRNTYRSHLRAKPPGLEEASSCNCYNLQVFASSQLEKKLNSPNCGLGFKAEAVCNSRLASGSYYNRLHDRIRAHPATSELLVSSALKHLNIMLQGQVFFWF